MARAVLDPEGARRADLAAIHIGKAQLGWDDAFYRDVLFTICRVRSSGELDHAGRKRFLAHLRACGWSGGTTPRIGADRPAAARKPLTRPQRLMWSLWQQLHDAGAVTDRRMGALLHFVGRQTGGVARLEWLNPAQEDLVIQSLKAWLKRTTRGGA